MRRPSLFIKIYLTLLASLALIAVASAAYVWIGRDRDQASWLSRRDAFLEQMLPADAMPQNNREFVRRLGRALDADVTVYAPDGRRIVSAGRPVPRDAGRRHRGGPGPFAVELSDGRTVVARLRTPPGPDGVGSLAYLALIAGVIGVASYPVVRHLTGRLERLRAGVARWGDGALDARVDLSGHDEVAAVAATFNQAAERVERLVASHRALLANASHELRSPLARLRMAVDLSADERDPRRREIVRNLAELDELVDEILLASRLDHDEANEAVAELDLLALVAEEGARSGVKVEGEPATVKGDARLLTRLTRNLMQNALRHGAPPVSARVATIGDRVELSVRDRGPGVSPDEADRVFEAFFRPRGRGESAGGWGLGLSLVRQIAERHGGQVRLDHPEGGGALFVVSLPRAGAARQVGPGAGSA